jgi:hypothetical protein
MCLSDVKPTSLSPSRADPPVGLDVDRQLEIAELAVGQEDAAVAASRRILLAGDRAVFRPPDAAVAVADFRRVLVPALQRLAIEEQGPRVLRRLGIGERMQERQRSGCRGGGLQESAAGGARHGATREMERTVRRHDRLRRAAKPVARWIPALGLIQY